MSLAQAVLETEAKAVEALKMASGARSLAVLEDALAVAEKLGLAALGEHESALDAATARLGELKAEKVAQRHSITTLAAALFCCCHVCKGRLYEAVCRMCGLFQLSG